MAEDKISYKKVKRIIKKHVKEEVCMDCILFLQDHVTKELNDIGIALKIELDGYNKRREIIKLPKVKRLNVYILRIALEKIYKQSCFDYSRDEGEQNSNTSFSKAGVEVA